MLLKKHGFYEDMKIKVYFSFTFLYCSILLYSSDLPGQYNYIVGTTESATGGGLAKFTGKYLFNRTRPGDCFWNWCAY